MFIRETLRKFLFGLFILLVLFLMKLVLVFSEKSDNNLTMAKEIDYRITYKQALELSKEFTENILGLMGWIADNNNDYGIGDKCFNVQKRGFIRLLSFTTEKSDAQIKNGYIKEKIYAKKLFKELTDNDGETDEIYGVNNDIFYYISLARTPNKNCLNCHKEDSSYEKFDAVGAILVELPLNQKY